jgi:hypothetical protein
VVSIVLTINSNYQAAIVSLVLGVLLSVVWKWGTVSETRSVASQISFIKRVIAGYELGIPLVTTLAELSRERYWFANALSIGLKRYLTGQPPKSSFNEVKMFGYEDLNAAMDIIEDSLQNGTDPTQRLRRVASRMEQRRASGLRILGQLNNAIYINKLGSAFFFPLFCGMSIQMLLASPTGASTPTVVGGITILLIGFIIISNYISNVFVDPKFSEGVVWFIGLSSVGVLVFKISSALALGFV